VPEGNSVRVTVKTLTPNFRTFMSRTDGGEWKPAGEAFTWSPHAGPNRLEVKAVNQFGVDGPVSTVELNLAAAGEGDGDGRRG
jgi:hypothetical protein